MAEKKEKVAKEKKPLDISKIVIIALLALILFLTAAILVFVVSDNEGESILPTFQTKEEDGENTMLLEEFIVNLKESGKIKHFLKITMALMYTDTDQTEVIEANINKIRDSIIESIRTYTYEDLLKDEGTGQLKKEMIVNVNEVLGQEIIKGIYVTDIIVQ